MSTSGNPIAIGWLNENSLRSFPFHEGVGMRPRDSAGFTIYGGWSVPDCLVVDMTVSMEGAEYDPYLYLGQMSVVSGTVTLVFCDRNGKTAFSVYATAETHAKYDSYPVSGTGLFLGSVGVVCLGDLDVFFEQTPEGAYSFAPEEALVEPTCIRPSAGAVRSLAFYDADGYLSGRLQGDVKLVAGKNIRFDYVPSGNELVVSADPNSGYAEDCDCSESGQSMVRSINGISVDRVDIVGDDCVEVSVEEGSGIVRISDKCSKPCCGCAETTFINQTINNLQTSVGTLAGNVASLGDRLTSFINSYVLSRKTLS